MDATSVLSHHGAMTNTDDVLAAYLECAVWASTDDDGAPLDRDYSVDDFATEAVESALSDVLDFVSANADDLVGMADEQIGHDFWLTRNRHGAGFWDRGLGEVGDRLTKASHPYGESDVYVGDDGKLYVS